MAMLGMCCRNKFGKFDVPCVNFTEHCFEAMRQMLGYADPSHMIDTHMYVVIVCVHSLKSMKYACLFEYVVLNVQCHDVHEPVIIAWVWIRACNILI